uniref:Ig-like domain-containing protein n=1 Tax=Pelusios castaneus TaxID=367368 RepID=A0A8C8S2Q5_9SAUR
MAWAPLLLALLTYCSGSSSQPVLTQTPSVSVSPRENVRLPCTILSTGAITSGIYPSWYQQKPGAAPLQVIYSTSNRPSGIPARFSRSISSTDAALPIAGVQGEDDAVYHWAVWAGSAWSLLGALYHCSRSLWQSQCYGHREGSCVSPQKCPHDVNIYSLGKLRLLFGVQELSGTLV